MRWLFVDPALLRSALFCPCHPERSRTPNAVRSKRSAATFGIWDKKVRLRFASLRMTGKIGLVRTLSAESSQYQLSFYRFFFWRNKRKRKSFAKRKRCFSGALPLLTPQAFEKAWPKLFWIALCEMYTAPDRFGWVMCVRWFLCRLSRHSTSTENTAKYYIIKIWRKFQKNRLILLQKNALCDIIIMWFFNMAYLCQIRIVQTIKHSCF